METLKCGKGLKVLIANSNVEHFDQTLEAFNKCLKKAEAKKLFHDLQLKK